MEDHLVAQIRAEFTEEELPGGVHAMTSLGIGPKVAAPKRPYIVWKELATNDYPEVSETSDVENRVFQIFVYDHKGDFARINSYLNRIKRRVKGMAPFEADGHRCSGSSWGGKSGNIADDGYDSGVRYGTARFTVSPPP